MDQQNTAKNVGGALVFIAGVVCLALGLSLSEFKNNRMNGLTISGIVLLSLTIGIGILVCLCCTCCLGTAACCSMLQSSYRDNNPSQEEFNNFNKLSLIKISNNSLTGEAEKRGLNLIT